MDFSSVVSEQNLAEAEIFTACFPNGEHRHRERLGLLTAAHPSPRREANISKQKPAF